LIDVSPGGEPLLAPVSSPAQWSASHTNYKCPVLPSRGKFFWLNQFPTFQQIFGFCLRSSLSIYMMWGIPYRYGFRTTKMWRPLKKYKKNCHVISLDLRSEFGQIKHLITMARSGCDAQLPSSPLSNCFNSRNKAAASRILKN
jgi:hypothetical protein